MKKIMLGGSRSISRFSRDEILKAGFLTGGYEFLVGDSYGADKIFRDLMEDLGIYHQVFHVEGNLRTKVFNFGTPVPISVDRNLSQLLKFQRRDDAMVTQCSGGVFLWDGYSKSTYRNINNLLLERKRVVLFPSGFPKMILNSPQELLSLQKEFNERKGGDRK